MSKGKKSRGVAFEQGKKVLLELRRGRVFRALMFSAILLSQVRYPLDLVAGEVWGDGRTRNNMMTGENGAFHEDGKGQNESVPDLEIQIKCSVGEEKLAEFCRDVMLDVAGENLVSAELFASMANAGTVFLVAPESRTDNGEYLIGRNEVKIPKNVIANAMVDEWALRTLKDTLRHEGVHFLQDRCGIFDDCKKLRPREACVVWTMAELDAMIKALVMEKPDVWNVDGGFDCLVDMVPLLSEYSEDALARSKIFDVVRDGERLEIFDVMAKFNMSIFGEYKDVVGMAKKLDEHFGKSVLAKIVEAEKNYDERLLSFEQNDAGGKMANGKTVATATDKTVAMVGSSRE